MVINAAALSNLAILLYTHVPSWLAIMGLALIIIYVEISYKTLIGNYGKPS